MSTAVFPIRVVAFGFCFPMFGGMVGDISVTVSCNNTVVKCLIDAWLVSDTLP